MEAASDGGFGLCPDLTPSEWPGGFTAELFNRRGTYMATGGKAERDLAGDYRAKARDLDNAGYPLLAAAVRGVAESYVREAEREEKRDDLTYA